ncbi:MAG: hypothetical protein OHK006_13940 [Thermodesulfovibrionales bacterium]
MDKEKALARTQGKNEISMNQYTKSSLTDQIKMIVPDAAVYTPRDLDSIEKARIEFVVDGILPKRQITLLTGKPGDGKTTLEIAMLGAILRGETFLDRETSFLPVVVWDDENPESTLKILKDLAGIEDNIHFIKAPPDIDEFMPPCKTCSQSCKQTLYDSIASLYDYNVIFVFDSRAQFEKEEENSGKTKHLNDFFRCLRDKGVTILAIHHAGKGEGNHALGHTFIKGGVDNLLLFEAPKRGQKYSTLELIKNRFRSPAWKMFLEVDHETLTYIDATQTVRDSSFSKIAAAIDSCDHANQNNIVKIVKENYPKWGDNSIRRTLKEGIAAYWTEEAAGRNNESIYKLTTDGAGLMALSYYSHRKSHNTIIPEKESFNYNELGAQGGHNTTPPVSWPGQCESCILTAGQRALCEVAKPCPNAR